MYPISLSGGENVRQQFGAVQRSKAIYSSCTQLDWFQISTKYSYYDC